MSFCNFAHMYGIRRNFENAEVSARCFRAAGGTVQIHLAVRITGDAARIPFISQCDSLLDAYDRILTMFSDDGMQVSAVMERYFLSDSANQESVLRQRLADRKCAVSVIQQSPLDGSKLAMLAILESDAEPKLSSDGAAVTERNGYTHVYTGGMRTVTSRTSRGQTGELLVSYGEMLGEMGMSLSDNCLRTWFFVRDIDRNYQGVVSARNQVFESQGLNCSTHFIASTGIGGCVADSRALVSMDAYAVGGLSSDQVRYLYAPTHMNRTSEYGVSFERGTAVDYGDCRQVFISGTASIDNRGQVVHPGDVRLQTGRMLENVKKLLEEAGGGLGDVLHAIVYLRDLSDYEAVAQLIGESLPEVPCVIVLAPVCRPGWLIEMECMAVVANADSRFRKY